MRDAKCRRHNPKRRRIDVRTKRRTDAESGRWISDLNVLYACAQTFDLHVSELDVSLKRVYLNSIYP